MADIIISEFMDEAAVAHLRSDFEVNYAPDLVDRPQALTEALGGARALIVRNRTQVTASLLDAGTTLECVGRLGVGLDNIDLPECKARGVTVYPATGANDLAVAEYVIATALMLVRRAYLSTHAVAAGDWPRQALIGGETSGRILGLIGFGSIARQVARRASALGMHVIAHDPFVAADDPAWVMAGSRSLDALLGEADVISLHTPLTSGTRHLIDANALAQMKPDAVLINAARGGVVDEAALANALREGRIGGAALDVFETEPLTGEAATRFAGLPNLILTPHIAGVTTESNVRVSQLIAETVTRHLKGAQP
ncbi:hydroxyacid dehydrogenase [Pseudohoeflea coraliihabitans]|uniref:Hydroxyacid dehydrogenase n=1 Tax=Pseudohoeflea coraliihabitans TaxID=2860393 RepID=A0ABS6WL03_9HYPH|nr:hydroxyacid dehydrogenase [Pseudohoeflea sp. DP4N28-3]